jgi:hypothetical protein
MRKTIAQHLFLSFKTSHAIPTRRVGRDFLIQATLDPHVRNIDYEPTMAMDGRMVAIDAIFVERTDGQFAVDFMDARPECDMDGRALVQLASLRNCARVISVTADNIGAEPRASSARMIWSNRSVRVHPRDYAEILEALDDAGTMSLGLLERTVRTRGESFAVFYAMACDGSIEIDLHDGLSLDAVVRVGSLHLAARGRAYGI